MACALAVTGCRDQAEDAIHEAFCRMLRLTRPPENLKAYAFRSVRNAAVDLVRRGGRTRPLCDDLFFDPAESPRQAAEREQFQHLAAAALATLGDDERETIVLHLFSGLTFREIAELRAAPQGTVVSWYRRGLARLRDRLEDER